MVILVYIKRLFLKLIDTLLGRTGFFITILGWFLLISGLWMLLNPGRAKRSLAGQGFMIIKGYLLMILIFLLTLLFSFYDKLGGMVSLNILIAIIILLAQAYYFLKKKAIVRMNNWVEKLSLKVLKSYAIIQIVIAILMLWLHKRIWY